MRLLLHRRVLRGRLRHLLLLDLLLLDALAGQHHGHGLLRRLLLLRLRSRSHLGLLSGQGLGLTHHWLGRRLLLLRVVAVWLRGNGRVRLLFSDRLLWCLLLLRWWLHRLRLLL